MTKGIHSEKPVCPCCFQRIHGDPDKMKEIANDGKTMGARKAAEKHGLSRQRVRYLTKKLEGMS